MYTSNIIEETSRNENYRKVLYTNSNFQLVVMKLKPREEIGSEIHHNHTQYIQVVKGKCLFIVNNEYIILGKGGVVVIDPGEKHNVANISKKQPLHLYTIYTPPEHPPGKIQKEK